MAIYKLTPTKANLIKSKNSLQFAKKGFELLDKKRTVLIREMMSRIDDSTELQERINHEFASLYELIKLANITIGSEEVYDLAHSIRPEEDFEILFRSVMGVEIPDVKFEDKNLTPEYGFHRTNPAFDKAVIKAHEIKKLSYELAATENAVYRLAVEIKKTQKRTNALEKIQIPKYTETIKYIEDVLDEKEREDFFRLKKVKSKKRK